MTVVRLGIIGASRIAEKILPSIVKVEEVLIKGLASQSPARMASFSKKLPKAHFFPSYAACFESTEIDAVYISTISSRHFDLIMEGLKCGKHVLCEKPLVLNEREAITAFNLAREKGLILQEGLMYRHHPQVVELLERAKMGLGELKHVHASFGFQLYDDEDFKSRARTTSAGGGGAINDLGCYAIDFINQVANGEVPDKVSCLAKVEHDIDVDIHAIWRYKSGLVASLDLSIIYPMLNVWEVVGKTGSVAALRHDPQGSADVPLLFTDTESASITRYIKPIDCFAAQFRNFARAVLGRGKPAISPEESILIAKVSEMLRRSAAELNRPTN